MRKYLPLFILLAFCSSMAGALVYAQQRRTDSLLFIINRRAGDTAGVNALIALARQQTTDSVALRMVQQGMAMAKRLGYHKGEALSYLTFAILAENRGNFGASIQYALNALSIFKQLHDVAGIATSHLALQAIYRDAGDFRSSLNHAFEGEKLASQQNIKGAFSFPGHRLSPLFLAEIGQSYVLMKRLDSASFYTQQAISQKELFAGVEWSFPYYLLATIQNMQGNYTKALQNYRKAIPLAKDGEVPRDTIQIFAGLSSLFRNTGNVDSAVHYAMSVVAGWDTDSEFKNLLEALDNLAQVYKQQGKSDSALKYIELSHTLKDSLFSAENNKEVQRITFAEALKQKELLTSQLRYKNKVQLFAMTGGILILLLVAGLLWLHNRQQLKSQQKIERAYSELKLAQAQLVQSEKMASLGELTAGIAHEIQNPLNFVTNFSEANAELLDELQQATEAGDLAEVKQLAKDIRENEEKIRQHGKRADGIVKSMLQHSRKSNDVKELADINILVDEYLRLSYHGFHAKNKNLATIVETNFDKSLGLVEVIPQEIGRVLLNLFNNAFYAVQQKKIKLNGLYEPAVYVSTKKEGNKIILSVKDNGIGMSPKVAEKVFQPFFTTKPTGEGTGLGLSLSYDIVTKGHGGTFSNQSTEGEGSEFTVTLPGA